MRLNKVANSLQHTTSAPIDWEKTASTGHMDTQKQWRKNIALELIPTHPHTTGGASTILFASKSVRLKTLTEIGSTFNAGQRVIHQFDEA